MSQSGSSHNNNNNDYEIPIAHVTSSHVRSYKKTSMLSSRFARSFARALSDGGGECFKEQAEDEGDGEEGEEEKNINKYTYINAINKILS